MRIFSNKSVFALLAVLTAGASAQLVNSTILAILNTTQLSPATKFVELLTSKPEYQPLLDLLSQPGNHTLFVPSDEVWEQIEQQQQQQQEESSTDADNDTNTDKNSPDVNVKINHAVTMAGKRVVRTPFRKLQEGNGESDNSTAEEEPNPFTQGPLANFTVEDVIRYHILNGTYLLSDLVENTTVISTLVTNDTLAINGSPLPLLVIRNITEPSSSTTDNGTSTGGAGPVPSTSSTAEPTSSQEESPTSTSSSSQEETSSITQEPTSSEEPSLTIESSYVASTTGEESQPTAAQESNSGFSWYPNAGSIRLLKAAIVDAKEQENQPTVNYTAGNGLHFANVTLFDIVASNGVIHVIDNVLVPPAKAFETIQNVSDISSYDAFLKKAWSFSQQLDNAPNVTIFAPSNDALSDVNIDSMDNDTLTQFVANYIVQGDVIYSTNVTNTTVFNSTDESTHDQDQPSSSSQFLHLRQFDDGNQEQQQQENQGFNVTTVAGHVLNLKAINQTAFSANGSQVIQANILTQNGVIHVIDHVFNPDQSNDQSTDAEPTAQ
ncbi:FAS1 domain-containing protein [Dichotomocladium elegans]|nr:FAS1 domain-containing protein [Dichotomocladium elegans]